MTLTEQLTDTGMRIGSGEISAPAVDAAKRLLLDTVGCALAGHAQPGVRESVELMCDWSGKAEATILTDGACLPAPHAAFANSAMIHALDYDDVHLPGSLHITSIIVPTVLATAEISGASGLDALGAIIMGIEVAGRLGTVCQSRRRDGGFLPSSLIGGFGAVVSAGRLFGLSREQVVHAMGIHYAQASGNRQALLDMTLTKRLQPALATRSALWATALAARGITGASRALEGEAGFFTVYMNGDIPTADEFTAARDFYEVERVSVKRYPSCGACHNVQIAAERLRREEALQGDEIERVELFGCGPGGLVGGPLCLSAHPQVDAQFSAAWGVAHALLRGDARLGDYTDEAVRGDAEVVALAQAMTYVPVPDDVDPAPERPRNYAEYTVKPQGVVVTTRDGRRLMRTQYPAQTFAPGRETFDAVVAKFHDCAAFSGICDGENAEALIGEVRELDRRPDVSGLIALTTRP